MRERSEPARPSAEAVRDLWRDHQPLCRPRSRDLVRGSCAASAIMTSAIQ